MPREVAEGVEGVAAEPPLPLVLEGLHSSDVSTADWLMNSAMRLRSTLACCSTILQPTFSQPTVPAYETCGMTRPPMIWMARRMCSWVGTMKRNNKCEVPSACSSSILLMNSCGPPTIRTSSGLPRTPR
jgi:hypothetical protein